MLIEGENFFSPLGFSNILEQSEIKRRVHFQVTSNKSRKKGRLFFDIASLLLISAAGPL